MNPSQADVASVIDLEDLKARCLGNMALVERVLTKFTGQLDLDLDELERAIGDGNIDQAAQLAHRIKGIAASVAARSLFENASKTEEQALDQSAAALPAQLERMRCDRAKLVETLQRSGRNLG